jgi:hypothetical protein
LATEKRELTAVERYVAALHQPVSAERLETYRPAGGDDLVMLVNYYWNIALCEALYPTLHCVEVALRNTLHTTMTNRFGNEFWFDDLSIIFSEQKADVDKARANLARRRQDDNSGKIVAELTFGFWVSLLTKRYEEHLWKPDGYQLVLAAFPSIPRKQRTRSTIHRRYFAINQLRNRVFHFEPIWHRKTLPQDHRDILDALGWISTRQLATVQLFDRFGSVVEQHSKQELRARLETYILTAT